MPNYMILYCLNKDLCGWSERVAIVTDDQRITTCPECDGMALIYDRDQTAYIENPTPQNTNPLLLSLGLVKQIKEEE
jgi:hypothetical protein